MFVLTDVASTPAGPCHYATPLSLCGLKRCVRRAVLAGLTISVGSSLKSMGGQALPSKNPRGTLHLDLSNFQDISMAGNRVVVAAGVQVDQVLQYLNSFGLSLKNQQSYSTFTVSGAVSTNVHGITGRESFGRSVTRLKILRVDASGYPVVEETFPGEKLFESVVGGFGLFGVVLEVELKTIRNVKLETRSQVVSEADFQSTFTELHRPAQELELDNDPDAPISLGWSRLMYPVPGCGWRWQHFFAGEAKETEETKAEETEETKAGETKGGKGGGLLVSNMAESPVVPDYLTRFLYKYMEVAFLGFFIRMMAMVVQRVTGRAIDAPRVNELNTLVIEDTKSVTQLVNPFLNFLESIPLLSWLPIKGLFVKDPGHRLFEVFVPNNQIAVGLTQGAISKLMAENFPDVQILNVTARMLNGDHLPVHHGLRYAPNGPMIAFVFFVRHRKTELAEASMAKIQNTLNDAVIPLGGTFYLPYRVYYKLEHLEAAYPNWRDVLIRDKAEFDPLCVFQSHWLSEIYRLANLKPLARVDATDHEDHEDQGHEDYEDLDDLGKDEVSEGGDEGIHDVKAALEDSPRIWLFISKVLRFLPVSRLDKMLKDLGKCTPTPTMEGVYRYVSMMTVGERGTVAFALRSLSLVQNTARDLQEIVTGYLQKSQTDVRLQNRAFVAVGGFPLIARLMKALYPHRSSSIWVRTDGKAPTWTDRLLFGGQVMTLSSALTSLPEMSVLMILGGLHHLSTQEQSKLLSMAQLRLNSYGHLWLREHNVGSGPNQVPASFVHFVHALFNAVTGEEYQAEVSEHASRRFKSCASWRNLLARYEFVNPYCGQQRLDTSRNVLMLFVSRNPPTREEVEEAAIATSNYSPLFSVLAQLEFIDVDSEAAYAKFIPDQPWYLFPFFTHLSNAITSTAMAVVTLFQDPQQRALLKRTPWGQLASEVFTVSFVLFFYVIRYLLSGLFAILLKVLINSSGGPKEHQVLVERDGQICIVKILTGPPKTKALGILATEQDTKILSSDGATFVRAALVNATTENLQGPWLQSDPSPSIYPRELFANIKLEHYASFLTHCEAQGIQIRQVY